jgi:hypothetical protein
VSTATLGSFASQLPIQSLIFVNDTGFGLMLLKGLLDRGSDTRDRHAI